MINRQWRWLFAHRILMRGEDYANYGAVKTFKMTGNSITATVLGEKMYEVAIDLENGFPLRMSCNCPYARIRNHTCKHMVAVLLKAEAACLGKGEQLPRAPRVFVFPIPHSPDVWNCPNCGSRIKKAEHFYCQNCGFPLHTKLRSRRYATQKNVAEHHKQSAQGNLFSTIFDVILFFIVVIGMFIFILTK